MLLRLSELGMALYYGKLKTFEADKPVATENPSENTPVDSVGDDSGWVSWAWNSLVGEDEDEVRPGEHGGSSGIVGEDLVVIV